MPLSFCWREAPRNLHNNSISLLFFPGFYSIFLTLSWFLELLLGIILACWMLVSSTLCNYETKFIFHGISLIILLIQMNFMIVGKNAVFHSNPYFGSFKKRSHLEVTGKYALGLGRGMLTPNLLFCY